MRRIIIVVIILIILISSAFVVYKNFIGDTKVGRIDIRGTVTSVTINGNMANILVEGKIENDTYYDKASVSINSNTLIRKAVYTKQVDISQIKVGDTVQVTFDGPVAESYPVQALAKIVNIIK